MTKDRSGVSVIIPAYGACPQLHDVVTVLLEQSRPPAEIIVVHSGPHDPTAALQALDPRLRVIHREERTLAGPARNIGLGQAHEEWIAFLDSDVMPQSDWLERLLDAATTPDRFVVGSIGYAVSGGYWGLCLWATEFSGVHPYLTDGEVQGGASANMLVPAEAVRRVGGFPEAFAASEDSFLTASLRETGLTNWLCTAARGDHFNKGGMLHCLKHLHWLGEWGAICRRAKPLRGAAAIKYRPLAAGLWLAKFVLMYYRVMRWGTGQRLKFLALAPGCLLGLLAWNLGFLSGLSSAVVPNVEMQPLPGPTSAAE